MLYCVILHYIVFYMLYYLILSYIILYYILYCIHFSCKQLSEEARSKPLA